MFITQPEIYDFIKILLSVLLGMFGKYIFDYFKEKRKIKRDKEFVVGNLKGSKKLFPFLRQDYLKIKEIIPHTELTVHELKQFEGFNADVLKSLSFPRYYQMFNSKATIVYEIS